jgi:hypothetical protein
MSKLFLKTIILMALWPTMQAQAKILSQSVAEVNRHVVTSREINMNLLLDQSLYPRKKKMTYPIDVASKKFYLEVNRVLIEWVVYLEGQDFSIVNLDKGEVKKSKSYLERSLFRKRHWKELGVSHKELNQLLRRKLIAKKFIQFKVNSTMSPVTDFEAKKYFTQNRSKFGELPFAQFKANIKKFLKKRHLDERLKNWFQVLQSKYKVKNHLRIATK